MTYPKRNAQFRSSNHRPSKPNSAEERASGVVWWSDRRLRELEQLAREFQRSGMGRQAAHVAAYREFVRERSALPGRGTS